MIVDDHKLVCEGLTQICEAEPDMKVVARAANGREAVERALATRPDIVLMDINMPEMNGVEAARQITAQQPEVRVIMLTMYREEEYLFEAIKAGAKDYLLKSADPQELLDAIRAVYAGEAKLDPAMAAKILEEFRRLSTRHGESRELIYLTDREQDILRLVAQGADNHELAKALGIAEKTVRNRLSVIFDKLHINNRTQAALYALKQGLASPPEKS
jgi:DNA-binding NarL/FixJ family response regulator